MKRLSQNGFGTIEWVLLVVSVGLMSLGAWFAFRQSSEDVEISNYQQCVDAGYPIMLSNPPQCNADGTIYHSDEYTEQSPPEEVVDDQVSQESSDEWVLYDDEDLGYTLSYPPDWNPIEGRVGITDGDGINMRLFEAIELVEGGAIAYINTKLPLSEYPDRIIESISSVEDVGQMAFLAKVTVDDLPVVLVSIELSDGVAAGIFLEGDVFENDQLNDTVLSILKTVEPES